MKGFVFDWLVYNNELHAHVLLEETKALIRIEGIKYFSYISLKDSYDFSESQVSELLQVVEDFSQGLASPVSLKFVRSKTLYGYQKNPVVPTILVAGDTSKSVKEIEKLFKIGVATVFGIVIGTPLEDLIPIDRKITALKRMSYYPFVNLSNLNLRPVPDAEKLSYLPDEYFISLKDFHESDRYLDLVQKPKVLSFDLECYKPSDSKGMPDPTRNDNFIFFVSMIFKKDTRIKKYQIVYGKSGSTHEVKTEKDLILKFFEIIVKEKPDVIIGFNTHSWDWWYINERMKVLKMKWPEDLGIYKKMKPKFKDFEWTSSAFLMNKIRFPKIPGVIVFDLYRYFVESKPRLQRHSLGFISMKYLDRTKLPMTQNRMVLAFEDFHLKGQSDSLRDVADYNMEDSKLVLDLWKRLHMFTEVRNQSNTLEVSMEDLYTRGLQIRAFNEIYAEAKKKDLLFNKVDIMPGQKYMGGFVLEPKKGFYENVIKLDVNSLYPNIVWAFNICYTTYLTEQQADLMDPKDFHTLEFETTNGDRFPIHFVKAHIVKGVTTEIVEKRLAERQEIKEKLSKERSGFEKKLLDDLQENLKLTVNSLVGMFGASSKFAKLPFGPAFGTITTKGRQLINEIRAFVEKKKYGTVVYSDTDSVFIEASKKKLKESHIFDLANEIVKAINKKFDPFKIKLEDIGYCLLFEAKKYTFYPIKENLELEKPDKIIYKGTDVIKRTTCNFVCDYLKLLTNMVFTKTKKDQVLKSILEQSKKLLVGDVPVQDLICSLKVGDSTSSTCFSKVFSERLIAEGYSVEVGDTLEYIVTEGKGPIGQRAKLVTELTPDDRIDFMYYLSRIEGCVDQIFSTVYPFENEIEVSGFVCQSSTPVKEISEKIRKKKLNIRDLNL